MEWQEALSDIELLAQKVGYTPDIIVAVVRGGLIPARILSKNLGVSNMHALTLIRRGESREITSDILENVDGKQILLVEDMLETGKSMVITKDFLQRKGADVKTACLYIMPMTIPKADFYVREVAEVVQFPWE